MPDRKKVLKGLEACRKTDCINCPYSALETEVCLVKYLLADTLVLLKDLEPVRPIRKKEIGAYHSLYCVCGNCGAWLLDGQKFCDECGRKVKWNARQRED